MARTARTALGMAAAMALCALACLAFAATRDGVTLSSLDALGQKESVLMSCADAPATSGGGALLWCADPSSPHCIPAAPDVPRIELSSSPDLYLLPSVPMPRPTYTLMSWPEPRPRVLASRPRSGRLERPPRA